ncbi:hypothetical protein [Kribbella sp. C-35]|uniref:hypothetical protein n=1 Tax=Kribbella sp. C-35 TaxID=2789276 RepID=UPI003978CEC7
MEDVREVSAELHRLAESEELEPFDTGALLARGHRGRRRRKIVAVGGAVTGVAAIALAATLLPGLIQAGGKPPVAGDQSSTALFESVQGIPRGEEGVGQRMTMAEAQRRCALRFPDEKRGFEKPYDGPFVGQRLSYTITIGQRMRMCTVPGGDKPTAALLAQVAKDPLPTTPAGQLRHCSVQTWVDVTGWRVTASARSSETGASLLTAVSPSGKTAIACEIDKSTLDGGMITQGTTLIPLDHLRYDSNVYTHATATAPAQLWTGVNIGGNKSGYTTLAWGRINGNATRIQLRMDAKTKTDVPVTDGWFAYYWKTPPTPAKIADLRITAYDRNGRIVKVLR